MSLCHKEVRRIAREMAGAAYETLASDNVFHASHPNQNKFVAKYWKNFLGQARQTLLSMLGGNYPDTMKEEIYDIYVKDRELQAMKGSPVVGGAVH